MPQSRSRRDPATLLALITLCASATLSGCVPVMATGAAVGTMAAIDRRSVGNQVEDQVIQVRGTQRLKQLLPGDEKAYAYVTSFDRRVLLTGLAPTEAVRQQAAAMMAKVPNVRVVYNELELPGDAASRSAAADTGLTAKVRAALIRDDRVPVHLVKVTSEAGSVYLLGLLTREEGERAAKVAAMVSGAKRIVTFYEFVDAQGQRLPSTSPAPAAQPAPATGSDAR
ncbi:MAG: BON domain-containing protein [Burkholderiaceae bacterium]